MAFIWLMKPKSLVSGFEFWGSSGRWRANLWVWALGFGLHQADEGQISEWA